MIDVLKGKIIINDTLNGTINNKQELKGSMALPKGGTSDYNSLFNKPRINGVELKGDITAEILQLQRLMTPLTNEDIENMFK